MPRWPSCARASDRRLVQDLNQGDGDSLGTVYDAYAEALYDYCLSMVAEPKAAADVVHDTFIDAHRRAPRMRDRMRLRAWLYGAARRRCLQRRRSRGLFWDWADTSTWRDEVTAAEAGLRPDEARELVESGLGRLDSADQETLLLTLRHGLTPADLSAVLGQPPRRTTSLITQAQSRAEAAIAVEMRALSRCCQKTSSPATTELLALAGQPVEATVGATGVATVVRGTGGGRRVGRRGPGGSRRPGGGARGSSAPVRRGRRKAAGSDPVPVRHLDDCRHCGQRARVTAGTLLELAPAPVLPAALRHRVMHTATDPELAGHRADIAARGGTLTAEGLPKQPDMPSKYTRRWLFVGGGTAGALLTALVAMMLMGPVSPNIRFPFDPRPQPSIGDVRQEAMDRRPGGEQQGTGQGDPRQPGGSAPQQPGDSDPRHRDERPPDGPGGADPDPRPTPPSPSPRPPAAPPVGELTVGPAEVVLDHDGATITLSAQEGPVKWLAAPSSERLSLSQTGGTLRPGASLQVQVDLKDRSLINLPGEATITVTDREGAQHNVRVRWYLSLL